MKPVKCLVTDLDGTLWNGSLIENGLDGVEPYTDRFEVLRSLDSRGILLSAASRNDREQGMEALRRFGIDDLFLVPQINFGPKYVSLQTIAETLNMGLDSFAFFDNEPGELDEIKVKLQGRGVRVDLADNYHLVLKDPQFQGDGTYESRHRREFYNAYLEEKAAQASQLDEPAMEPTLLETTISVQSGVSQDIPRFRELLNRTNQLNFSGNEYGQRELEAILESNSKRVYTIRVRSGRINYSRAGVCIIDTSEHGSWHIQDLVFSCRIFGKGLEAITLSYFLELAKQGGINDVVLDYRPTEKNQFLPLALARLPFTEERVDRVIKYHFSPSNDRAACPNNISVSSEVDKLRDNKVYQSFKNSLPQGLAEKLSRFDDEQWLPERWEETKCIRDSIAAQVSQTELWDNMINAFEAFYLHLDNIQHIAEHGGGKYCRALPLGNRNLTDYLVRASVDDHIQFTWLWRYLQSNIVLDPMVLDAVEKNSDTNHLALSLFSQIIARRESYEPLTKVALNDPRNLANAILIGKRASEEYVTSLVRHPDAGLLHDPRVIDAIRASNFPTGLVYLAENAGYADLLFEFAHGFNGVIGIFPFAIDETTLPYAVYGTTGGCGGGRRVEYSFKKMVHDRSQHTISLFPAKGEFDGLSGQYYISDYMYGSIGFINFVETADGLVIVRNKTNYRRPTDFDQEARSELIIQRDIRGLEFSEQYDAKFSHSPELLWYAAHEYARRTGKSWVGLLFSFNGVLSSCDILVINWLLVKYVFSASFLDFSAIKVDSSDDFLNFISFLKMLLKKSTMTHIIQIKPALTYLTDLFRFVRISSTEIEKTTPIVSPKIFAG